MECSAAASPRAGGWGHEKIYLQKGVLGIVKGGGARAPSALATGLE